MAGKSGLCVTWCVLCLSALTPGARGAWKFGGAPARAQEYVWSEAYVRMPDFMQQSCNPWRIAGAQARKNYLVETRTGCHVMWYMECEEVPQSVHELPGAMWVRGKHKIMELHVHEGQITEVAWEHTEEWQPGTPLSHRNVAKFLTSSIRMLEDGTLMEMYQAGRNCDVDTLQKRIATLETWAF